MAGKRVNLHIYPSPFTNETRILKITATLAERKVFPRIFMAGVAQKGLPCVERIDRKRTVIRLERGPGNGRTGTFWKALQTMGWSLRVLSLIWRMKPVCVNCHSLPALPVCVLGKILTRCRLVYDTHELETETSESRGLRRLGAKAVERLGIGFADATSTVNDSIRDWYSAAYRLKDVAVVRNVPPMSEALPPRTDILRRCFSLPADDLVFLYHGAVETGRGVDIMLKVFSGLRGRHLVVLGFGDAVGLVNEAAARYGNIHYHPAVKPGDILSYAAGADAGVHLIENTCLNHFLCLPNKLFEYLNAGLPVIVSDFPNMAGIVDRFGCGWRAPGGIEALRALVCGITRADLAEKREGVIAARKCFGWKNEEPSLLGIYRRLGL